MSSHTPEFYASVLDDLTDAQALHEGTPFIIDVLIPGSEWHGIPGWPDKIAFDPDAHDLLGRTNAPFGPTPPNTVSRRIGFARQFFRAAFEDELIDRNPFAQAGSTTVKGNRKRDYFVSDAEAALVIEACPAPMPNGDCCSP